MKTVIVTGASRGIGAAIVRNLRVKGVRVIGVARNGDLLRGLAMEKVGSAPCEVVVGDVCEEEVVKRAVNLAIRDGHTLDGLILNAATIEPIGVSSTIDVSRVNQAFQINTTSIITWYQQAITHLRASKGRIIYVSSGVIAHPHGGIAAYCASKAAAEMIICILAQEEPEIVTLSLSPGMVQTDMLKLYYEEGKSYMPANRVSKMKQQFEEDNLMQPQDVAESYVKAVLGAPRELSGQSFLWNNPQITSL